MEGHCLTWLLVSYSNTPVVAVAFSGFSFCSLFYVWMWRG